MKDLAEVVQNGIDDRHGKQCQQQRKRHATDDQNGNRASLLGARADGDQQGDHAGNERQRGHENRSQSVAIALQDCLLTWHAGCAELVYVVDLQDRRFLHHAKQHQDAKGRVKVKRFAAEPQTHQPKGDGDGEGKENRDRMDQVFVLCCQHDVHADE